MARYLTFEIWRRIYRWTRCNLGLERRISRLKAQLSDLPRSVGVRLEELDPKLDEKIASLREPDRELVIADFDQDGGILPRYGNIAGIAAISPREFMTRTGFPVLLVDVNGRLGVRKEFKNVGSFVQEIEAMIALEARNCPVPQLMNIDWDAHSLTMTFIPGDVVRELLAVAGADIRDRTRRGPYSRSVDKERIRSGRAVLPKVLSNEAITRIHGALRAIHAEGYVLEDVKFGNIILSEDSGRPIFIDLERALPTASLPSGLVSYLRQIDIDKFNEHFGHSAAPGIFA